MQSYWPLVAIGVFLGWRIIKVQRAKKQLPGLLNQGAVVVDVRSRGEFSAGSAPRSINIPLDELEKSAQQLDAQKPVVLCCASGTRSAMAAVVLKRKGFKTVLNVGSWRNACL